METSSNENKNESFDIERLKVILEPLLRCPICYEVVTGSYFQCNEGHHVCASCRSRLPACPLCRSFFYGTRNFAVEQIIETLRNIYFAGKGGEGPEHELFKREDSEKKTPVKLKRVSKTCSGLFRCHILQCKERLPLARLLQHIRYFHPDYLLEGSCDEHETFHHTFELKKPLKPNKRFAIQVRGMGLFFIFFTFGEKTAFRIWVSMCDTEVMARTYDYTLTIRGLSTEAVFTDRMSAVSGNPYCLFRSGRCLQMTHWQHNRDLTAMRLCSLTIARAELHRQPTPTLTLRPQQNRRAPQKDDAASLLQSPPTVLT